MKAARMTAARVGHPEASGCFGPDGYGRTGEYGQKWGKIGKNSTKTKEICGKCGFCLDFVPLEAAL
jgi:hypothetical protein